MFWKTKDCLTLSQEQGVAWRYETEHWCLIQTKALLVWITVAAVLKISTLKSQPGSTESYSHFNSIIKVLQRENWITLVQLIIVLLPKYCLPQHMFPSWLVQLWLFSVSAPLQRISPAINSQNDSKTHAVWYTPLPKHRPYTLPISHFLSAPLLFPLSFFCSISPPSLCSHTRGWWRHNKPSTATLP